MISAFPYVGGKTLLSDWITGVLPSHETYVEPFGGSAAVLLNKPRSTTEVYNDLDGDIVHFFQVARDRPEELVDWIQRTPYSEELHNQYADAFYSGERSDDAITRTGRFLYLRYSQFGGKYAKKSGFKRDTARTKTTESQTWAAVDERIDEICQRLQGVSIQNGSFESVIDRYDSAKTVFYCDPPYLHKEDTYRVDGFDHDELATALQGIDGKAIVSYTDRPQGLYDGWTELLRSHYHDAGNRKHDNQEKKTERLIMNYEPTDVARFVDHEQKTLIADGGRAEFAGNSD